MFKLKIVSVLIFTTLLFVACKKEKSLVGDLKIDVSSVSKNSNMKNSDIRPEIYIVENSSIPLISDPQIDSDNMIRLKDLLPGNYVIKYWVKKSDSFSSWWSQPSIIFQIKPNEETSLYIDLSPS